jgi:hypothetical protein
MCDHISPMGGSWLLSFSTCHLQNNRCCGTCSFWAMHITILLTLNWACQTSKSKRTLLWKLKLSLTKMCWRMRWDELLKKPTYHSQPTIGWVFPLPQMHKTMNEFSGSLISLCRVTCPQLLALKFSYIHLTCSYAIIIWTLFYFPLEAWHTIHTSTFITLLQ